MGPEWGGEEQLEAEEGGRQPAAVELVILIDIFGLGIWWLGSPLFKIEPRAGLQARGQTHAGTWPRDDFAGTGRVG
ncbi:MAG: hypothetical protein WAN38_10595 [Terriglobales bacterium]